jgi:hypothetical protein
LGLGAEAGRAAAAGVNAAMGARMDADLVFEDANARRDFGWAPRPFRPRFGPRLARATEDLRRGSRSPRRLCAHDGQTRGDALELAAALDPLGAEAFDEQPANGGNEGRAAGQEDAVDGGPTRVLQGAVQRAGDGRQLRRDPVLELGARDGGLDGQASGGEAERRGMGGGQRFLGG